MRLLNPPTRWRVLLQDGSVVDVWADSAEGLAGPDDLRDYHFGNLMEVAEPAQVDFDVVATTPSDPQRVVVTVAQFPRSAVREVLSA